MGAVTEWLKDFLKGLFMKTALRTGAVTLSALLATVGLTGFTTIKIGSTERINWQYERTSVTPEDLKDGKVDLNFGDYEFNPPGTPAGAAFDAKDGLPKDKTGVFSLRGALGANATSTSGMPGLTELLTKTHKDVSKATTGGTYNAADQKKDQTALESVVPNDFAFLVAKALPERLNILDNPAFKPTSDANANLIMKPGQEATRVWATFILEGAGHKNSFGYFIYDPNCAPKHRNQVKAFDGNTLIKTVATKHGSAGTYTQGNSDNTRLYEETRDCKPRPGTTAEIIVLPNASQDAPLPRAGSAKLGTSGTGPTAYLGEIPAGMAMGFVIVSNGWTQTGSNILIPNPTDPTDPTTPSIFKPGASKTQSTQWIFYSLSDLNPEPTGVRTVGTRTYDDLTKHVILLKDGNLENFASGYHRFALGFEDMNRSSTGADHDFNDLVMMLHVEKKQLLSNVKVAATPSNVVTTPEVIKSVTENNNTVKHFPSATTWATLAYEDLWPAAPTGFFYDVAEIEAAKKENKDVADYDFNDLVVKYRSSQTLVNNRITQIDLTYRLDARGALLKNGFAVQLRGLKQSEIESIRVTDPNGKSTILKTSDAYKLEAPALGAFVGNNNTAAQIRSAIDAGSNQVTIRLFNDAFTWLPELDKYTADSQINCKRFYNTYRACPVEDSKIFTVQIKFLGSGVDSINNPSLTPPYNPFIFNYANPSREVHLPNLPPTLFSRNNNRDFNTKQDATDTSTWSKTYVTEDGRPWAVHIPYEWDHPQESNRIGDVFTNFGAWVNSAGANNTDWYTKPTVSNTFRGTRKFPK
jgi:LruC domain-containing protein